MAPVSQELEPPANPGRFIPIGSFELNEREKLGDFHTVRAVIDEKSQTKILNLVRVGGELKFTTSYATYATRLEGVPQALFHFNACNEEAGALMAARQ
jgi:hypothetical protein